MSEASGGAIEDIRSRAAAARFRVTRHPDHERGACCLVHGKTKAGRHLHVVCTTEQPILIIITVYEPKSPKWVTPTRRRHAGA